MALLSRAALLSVALALLPASVAPAAPDGGPSAPLEGNRAEVLGFSADGRYLVFKVGTDNGGIGGTQASGTTGTVVDLTTFARQTFDLAESNSSDEDGETEEEKAKDAARLAQSSAAFEAFVRPSPRCGRPTARSSPGSRSSGRAT